MTQTMKSRPPQKPKLLEVDVEGLPSELVELKKWVIWKLIWNGKKWDKIPVDPVSGHNVDHQSEKGRCTLGQAFTLLQADKCDGIGFSLGGLEDTEGLIFIDLDGCVQDGVIADWAKSIIKLFPPCWLEYSPSGGGIHMLVRGKIPRALKFVKDHVGVEVYAAGRYFAVTGNMVNGAVDSIPVAQEGLNKLFQQLAPKQSTAQKEDAQNETDDDFAWLKECLDGGFLDSELDEYSRWLSVGMALHARFGEKGGQVWEEWSAKHDKHVDGECYQKVRTFKKKTGKLVQFGTLVKIIRENGGPEPPRNVTDDRRVKIQVVDGEVEEISMKCLIELAKHPAIYKRNGRLVEVIPTPGETYPWRIAEIGTGRLTSILTGLIWFYRLNNIGNKKDPEFIEIAANPPRIVIESILEDPELENIRQLNDVATFPFFAPDGKLVIKEGFDQKSGVLKISNSEIEVVTHIGEILDSHVRNAVHVIEKCFGVFSFDEEQRRPSIWTAASGIMTLLARRMLRIRPAILIISENRGSGKTQISEQIIRCGTGESKPVPSYLRSGQQLLTDLFSVAGTGRNYIYYDNLRDGSTFGDPVLDGIITSGRIQDRVFGKNNLVESRHSDFMIMANGNNVAVSDDMVRRCLLIKLKTQSVKNYQKPYGEIMTDCAAEVAAACMTILQWHAANGFPEPPVRMSDDEGFGDWSKVVRNAIFNATAMIRTSDGVDIMKTQDTLRTMDSKAEMTDDLLTGIWDYTNGYNASGKKNTEFRSIDLAADLTQHPVPDHAKKLAGLFSGSRNLSVAIGISLRSRNGHVVEIEGRKLRLKGKPSHGSKMIWTLCEEV